MASDCPFDDPKKEKIVVSNDLSYAVWDLHPVNPGHLLIIPFRHVASFFDTTREERVAIFNLADRARDLIDGQFHPDGYNFGVNIGEPAGQAVMHVHFHLIPRYRGDAGREEGGVRRSVPAKGK
jgi:diadenosine tetraphosphate (Ap4A) HIT family hydrolase